MNGNSGNYLTTPGYNTLPTEVQRLNKAWYSKHPNERIVCVLWNELFTRHGTLAIGHKRMVWIKRQGRNMHWICLFRAITEFV